MHREFLTICGLIAAASFAASGCAAEEPTERFKCNEGFDDLNKDGRCEPIDPNAQAEGTEGKPDGTADGGAVEEDNCTALCDAMEKNKDLGGYSHGGFNLVAWTCITTDLQLGDLEPPASVDACLPLLANKDGDQKGRCPTLDDACLKNLEDSGLYCFANKEQAGVEVQNLSAKQSGGDQAEISLNITSEIEDQLTVKFKCGGEFLEVDAAPEMAGKGAHNVSAKVTFTPDCPPEYVLFNILAGETGLLDCVKFTEGLFEGGVKKTTP